MIDSHTHTHYSKHATGTVDELVQAAISKGIGVLTITDHAPFYVDKDNRLLESELDQYFADIERAKQDYKGAIKILSGLEFDYMPGSCDYTANILSRYELDYVIGSIHYIPIDSNDIVKVWDLSKLANIKVVESYFKMLAELLKSELFDAVGHADSMLRGVAEVVLDEHLEPLLPLFIQHNIAFELNASGLRKTTLDSHSGREVSGKWSYPSLSQLPKLIAQGTHFTIGSDAHQPLDAGAGVNDVINTVLALGLNKLCYFESRQRVVVPLSSIITSVN